MKKSISVIVILFWCCAALASTADDISKNVNRLIRSAENEFFAGKTNDAASILQKAEEGLLQLKSEDPSHKSLKTLQTKYDRLKKRVDKKLENSNPSKAPNANAAAEPANSSTMSPELSRGAQGNLKSANREMDFAEQEFIKGEKSLQDQKFNLVESYLFNANSKLESASTLLDRVVKSNKANPDHPDVAAAFQRHKALEDKLTAFTNKAHGAEESIKQGAAQAKEDDAKLNQHWLPKITPFTDTSSSSRLQYPGSYNDQELARQEKLYGQAQKTLQDVENEIPAASQPYEIKNAVDKLRFTIQVYEDEKKADNKNRLQPIESTLSGWENRFEQNKNWNENSDQGLFVIPVTKLEYQKKQIDELAKVSAGSADGFRKRLKALEEENTTWGEKKRRWQERPRPFPQARMTDKKLEAEMKQLLENRNIKVDDLVIVDKDWWVQAGEFRTMTAAVRSKDDQGKFWKNISFRQMQTLTGFGPTEIYDISTIRIPLP